MKRLLLTLALLCLPALAHAQCNGIFPNNTVCGNVTGGSNTPRPTNPSAFLGAAGGSNGQIQYNNGGALGGFGPITGDISLTVPGAVSTIQHKTGNGVNIPTSTGSLTAGDCVKLDTNGNFVDAGAACVTQPLTAACNVVSVASAGVSISAGTKNLTVLSATFTSADVGKVISIPGAGTTAGAIHSTLNTTITAFVDATHVTVNDNAGTTLTAAAETIIYGTDDTTAFQTAFSATTFGAIDISTSLGCMITGQINVTLAKALIGTPYRSTIYFRQTSGTSQKTLFNVTVNGFSLFGVIINADGGSTITTTTAAVLISAAGNGFTMLIRNCEFNGNRSLQLKEVMGAIGGFGQYTQILNNSIHDFAWYPLAAGSGASHVLVAGNNIYNGPRGSIAAAFIAFLSSGVNQIMQDVRVANNYIDMSDLAVVDMNVGIYVFGGNTGTFAYTEIVISGNTIIGRSGATASTSGGFVGMNCRNATVTSNDIRYTGENIGSGCDQASLTGNVLTGGGTYGIEASGQIVSISGNSINVDGNSLFGMSIGQCVGCVVSGNFIFGTTSPNATFVGIFWFTGSGTSSDNNIISNNSITLPNAGATKGIQVACVAGSISCSHYALVGNNISGGSATSTGIQLDGGAGTNSGYIVGPSYLGQNTGVASSVALCYVAGANQSTIKTSGAGFPSVCN